ncbi:MAG: patatin-like phospholipase family protein [Clostridia bacterium]|nr:patatin-like phospholipase family protein [Clostridia bacterium]
MKRAIVIEGGALRGIHTSGVLDALMKYDIFFPYVIGVSAGALNAFNYVSGQPGRSAKINLEYIRDDRYFNLRNIAKSDESAFNFDFMLNGLTEIIPFDFDTFNDESREFVIVATDLDSGKPIYFRKSDCEDIFKAGAASASLPIVSPPVELHGKRCLDGGIADPIPVLKAMSDGNEKIVVVLTRHKGFRKKTQSKAEKELAARLYKDSPEMLQAALNTNDNYNKTLDLIDSLEEEGKIFVIRPSKEIDISFLERDTDSLGELYREGLRDGEASVPSLCDYLGITNSLLQFDTKAPKYNIENYVNADSLAKQSNALSAKGVRLEGSDAHRAVVENISYEIKKSSLHAYRDPYFFNSIKPSDCSLSLHLVSGCLSVPCIPLHGSGFCDDSVTAELCFLDDNKSYKFINASGKIAVITLDESDLGVRYNEIKSVDSFVDGCFGCAENSPFTFLKTAKLASVRGLICIWNGEDGRIFADNTPISLKDSSIPAVWISKKDGEKLLTLKSLHQTSEVSLSVRADVLENESSEAVYCMIKGSKCNESVIIATHTDGFSSDYENGIGAVLSLIRALREKRLYRNVIFVFSSGRYTHNEKDPCGIARWLSSHPDLWDGKNGHMKAAAAIAFDKVGLQNEIIFSSNNATDDAYLQSAERRDAAYTILRTDGNMLSDGHILHSHGIPTVCFSGDETLHSFDRSVMIGQMQSALDCLAYFEEIPKEAIGKVEKQSFFDTSYFGGKE